MRKAIDRSFLTRLFQTTALSLALMTATTAGVRAEIVTVQGDDGANGADGLNPGDSGQSGGDGEPATANAGSVTFPQNSATAIGGNGGSGGSANMFGSNGGNGGNGGAATATATTTITSGSGGADASASGGRGGEGGSPVVEVGLGGSGGVGGAATALATGSSGRGNVTVSASATGGAGGTEFSQDPSGGIPGTGGKANAMADASAAGGGTATANSVAEGGLGGDGFGPFGTANATADASATGGGTATANATAIGNEVGSQGLHGTANATSNAETAKGAMAQAESSGLGGSSGEAQSTAKTSFEGVSVQSTAVAPTGLGFVTGITATTDAIVQGGSGQAFANPGQTAYAFSTGLPNKAYAATLIGGASNVANALLGPSDKVFGTAILGANYAPDGGGASLTYSASSTFDFAHRGDLQLGLIDSQETGFANSLGFESMEFTIIANGVEILDSTFRSLAVAESFFHDDVIDLGSNLGPDVDLTFNYNLVADGSGGFGFDLAVGGAVSDTVPEPSTWAMMLLGFAGLAFAGSRRAKAGDATLAR
jgi:PEP-CTERM motif